MGNCLPASIFIGNCLLIFTEVLSCIQDAPIHAEVICLQKYFTLLLNIVGGKMELNSNIFYVQSLIE